MGLAKELNELFRHGSKFSYQKFADGHGKGVAAARDAFGAFEVGKAGSNSGDRGSDAWILVYCFANRPNELVALEGYNDSYEGLDLSNSEFVDVVADTEVFTVNRKVDTSGAS